MGEYYCYGPSGLGIRGPCEPAAAYRHQPPRSHCARDRRVAPAHGARLAAVERQAVRK